MTTGAATRRSLSRCTKMDSCPVQCQAASRQRLESAPPLVQSSARRSTRRCTRSCTLGSGPQILQASVEMVSAKSSSQQLARGWQVEILTAPLRLASCSPTQPAAPALGLSAGAGLTPPVKRFAAAGRPAFICSTARVCCKTPSNAMEIGSVSAPARASG